MVIAGAPANKDMARRLGFVSDPLLMYLSGSLKPSRGNPRKKRKTGAAITMYFHGAHPCSWP